MEVYVGCILHSFALDMRTCEPPSTVIVAPFTYAPTLDDKKRAVPATSSGVPIRESGIRSMIRSFAVARVWAITEEAMV